MLTNVRYYTKGTWAVRPWVIGTASIYHYAYSISKGTHNRPHAKINKPLRKGTTKHTYTVWVNTPR